MHSNKLPNRCKEYYKFTTCRNPFSRTVAAWWQLLQRPGNKSRQKFQTHMRSYMGGTDFSDFAKWAVKRHQYKNYAIMFDSQTEWHNGITFDYIIRCENMEDDFNSLPFIDKPTAIKKLFAFHSERKPWREYYTNELKQLIYQAYKDDFERFGYESTIPR
jgi:hypothetical protein